MNRLKAHAQMDHPKRLHVNVRRKDAEQLLIPFPPNPRFARLDARPTRRQVNLERIVYVLEK